MSSSGPGRDEGPKFTFEQFQTCVRNLADLADQKEIRQQRECDELVEALGTFTQICQWASAKHQSVIDNPADGRNSFDEYFFVLNHHKVFHGAFFKVLRLAHRSEIPAICDAIEMEVLHSLSIILSYLGDYSLLSVSLQSNYFWNKICAHPFTFAGAPDKKLHLYVSLFRKVTDSLSMDNIALFFCEPSDQYKLKKLYALIFAIIF